MILNLLSRCWRWLTTSCWLSHAERMFERDAKGRLQLVCPRCQDAILVLAGQKRGKKIKPSKAIVEAEKGNKVVSIGRGI